LISSGQSGLGAVDPYRPHPMEKRAVDITAELIGLENTLLVRLRRLHAVEAKLRKLASHKQGSGRRAIRVIEMERQRLGRELHTGVGQLLAAIRLQVELAGAHLENPPAPVIQALQRIAALADDALEQVRTISRLLYAPEWQRLSIEVALQQLWDLSGVAHRFAGTVHLPPLRREPPPDVKTLLYRAAQEALANAIRHSRATRLDLALENPEDRVLLTVQDNGIGFDTVHTFQGRPSVAAGIGLRSIREQAAALGGKLLVQSGPTGTKVEISVPA
jgi:signal transduction histidine kinase